jgi:hypothetical protein
MSKRIKNLKYDPLHADKPMKGYSHLEYLDKVFTISQAEIIIEYEKKNKCRTMEIVEVKKEKPKKIKKEEAPELKMDSSKFDEESNDFDS